MNRARSAAAAALLGGLYVGLEAVAEVVWGVGWLPSPLGLIGPAIVLGALLMAPLGLVGRGPSEGVAAAGVALGLVEAFLLVTIDAPPFQEAPWYVGSPVVAVGALAAAAAFGGVVFRWSVAGWAGAAVLIWPLLKVESTPTGPGGGDGENVLLITLDTTRADRIGAYGYEAARTPNLDRLASEGTRYSAAFANIAVTGPSHTSMLGGRGTWTHGTLLNGIPVPAEEALLAERLSANGYATGAFVSAYVLDGDYGFSRGFDVYDDDFSAWKGSTDLLPRRVQAAVARRLAPDEVLERRGDRTTDAALDWLQAQDGSWFLWVHLFDPHGPYDPPAEYLAYAGDPRSPEHTSMAAVDLDEAAPYLRESLRGITDLDYVMAAYDGEIAFADAQIGRLLEAAGPDALVVVAGDHGESFGEGGVWFDHGDDVQDAALHVPLIVRHPSLPVGVDDRLVELDDVAPTILDLLGETAPTDLDGVSTRRSSRVLVRSLIYDREANLAARAQGGAARPTFRMAGLRSPNSLFVRREHSDFADAFYRGEGDGFQLVTDVDVSAGMDLEVLAHQADQLMSGDAERSAVELTPAERARLEALGYLE